MLHGVLLIALFSCAAFYIGDMEFIKKLSFSPMIVGIILGMHRHCMQRWQSAAISRWKTLRPCVRSAAICRATPT